MRLPLRALATLLLAAPLAATLPVHAQYSIATVTFKHPGPYTRAELLAASGLEPGQALMHDSLGNAAQRLLNTGLFSDATIDYTGTAKARDVVVDLKPIPLDKLLPASFENFVWFTPGELAAGIHAHVPLYRGVASDAGTLPDDIQSALQQMLAAKGITATLSHEIIEPTNLHPIRVVSFRIEQPSVRLNTVHLAILSPTAAQATLTPRLQQAARSATSNPFNEGLSGLTLQDILLGSVRSAGYIEATLDGIQRTVSPSPTDPQTLLVTYSVRILTGDSYKVSTLTFAPTPLYSAADFARDARLHPGDIADGSDLAKTEAAISSAYLSHGYLDIYVLSHPALDATAHTVAYTLEPIPGDIYHLHTATPTGLSPEALQEFNSTWQMKPGDVYNPAYVSEFIHNNTALRHLSTYAGSFQASADPQTHLVDLTLTFYPSNGQ
jgi:outer membrane protein insertion porin family